MLHRRQKLPEFFTYHDIPFTRLQNAVPNICDALKYDCNVVDPQSSNSEYKYSYQLPFPVKALSYNRNANSQSTTSLHDNVVLSPSL
jgi:hypothetical protein